MVGINSPKIPAATPEEQIERNEAFDTYEAPVNELNAALPKPLTGRVRSFEGKEEENFQFWPEK
ncbi:Gag protein [Phytophthora palmivora]|uniref:Gag protein n=1 Tax=Phytophthora palmivora TaxID=4796 RepID=A0A2P4YVU8_9STRA|nr:Gag protein [Phytophthora palmivora]